MGKTMTKKQRKAVDHKQATFTLWDLRVAWDKALAGSTVGEHRIPVARSFESFSYRALEKELERLAQKRK